MDQTCTYLFCEWSCTGTRLPLLAVWLRMTLKFWGFCFHLLSYRNALPCLELGVEAKTSQTQGQASVLPTWLHLQQSHLSVHMLCQLLLHCSSQHNGDLRPNHYHLPFTENVCKSLCERCKSLTVSGLRVVIPVLGPHWPKEIKSFPSVLRPAFTENLLYARLYSEKWR